ncbi:MAG: sterol desaturase family protein [Saprospiraceae bacterium]|nr:sterol desaturase family protein [Candidatus Defluviibacterium haderslevense]MBK7242520.1 sterol desaturase family protein [Candidatus Defluviibacterium haderslevense]
MQILPHFTHGQDMQQLMICIFVFTICWNLENIYGVTKDYRKWRHDFINALFVIPGVFLQLTIGYVFIRILLNENIHQYGILHYFSLDSTVEQLIGTFIFLDFTYYIYHYLMHKVKLVWPFHAVHHSDTVLNVSTSLREHPLETCIRLGHYILAACLLGPAFWIITLHQFVQIISKIIIHSNFRLPEQVDKYLSYVILTPNMHHVHHHYVEPYTDSNYGDLLSIWDRMFGTFTYLDRHEVVFGLDKTIHKTLTFKELIMLPFRDKTL